MFPIMKARLIVRDNFPHSTFTDPTAGFNVLIFTSQYSGLVLPGKLSS